MKTKGFNLVELMTVIAIIAVLAGIAYPIYTRKVAESRTKNAPTCLSSVATAMENYYTNYGAYPAAGDVAALGFDDNECGSEDIYEFNWVLGPEAQYYRITVTDSISSVYAGGAQGPDVWVLCSHNGTPINIQSPINEIDPDEACW